MKQQQFSHLLLGMLSDVGIFGSYAKRDYNSATDLKIAT